MSPHKLRKSLYGAYNPSRSSVSLLLHGDGTNGSTTMTDSSPSPKTVTANGNAQISTAVVKYGTGSIALDGTGDYLSSAFNSGLDLLPGSFTVECWIYSTNLKSGGQRIVATGGGLPGFNGTNGIHFLSQINDATGTVSAFLSNNTGSPIGVGGTGVVAVNTWTHLAFVHDATAAQLRVFIRGVMSQGSATGVARPTTNPTLGIGTIPGEAGGASTAFQGYMDEIQITKGVAKYNMSFTPPTKPYPNS